MAVIKKITDKNGADIFLRTHTKAIVDDNGYTAESRLQAMQDEINQAQLEIGAVPSDLAPTENSTNWVTSGGIFNAMNVGGLDNEIDLDNYTEVNGFINNSNKWNTSYKGKFIPITPEKDYKITATSESNSAYAFLTSNIVGANNTSVSTFADGITTRGYIMAGESVLDTAPVNAFFLWVGTSVSAQDDCIPKSVTEINSESASAWIKNISFPNEAYPDSSSLVDCDLLYKETHKLTQVTLSNSWVAHGTGGTFTPSGIDGTNGVIHYDSDPSGTSDRCSLDVSSLKNGSKYLISFDVLSSTNQYAGSIGALPAYNSSWVTMLDINGENKVAYKNHISFVFQKTSSFSVIAFSPSSFSIFPLDLTISNFSLCMVEDVEDIVNEAADDILSQTATLYKKINLSDYYKSGTVNYYINLSENKWKTSSASTSFFVPIVPGKKYKIIGNEAKVSRYAILSNTNHTAESTPSYVGMDSAKNISLGGTVTFTAPEGAAYVYLNRKLDNINDTPVFFGIVPDNVSELLQETVDSFNGNYEHVYYGEKIKLNNTFSYDMYSSNSASGQSAALYGDYLFILTEYLTNVYCYNMRTKSLLYNLTTNLSKGSTWHCTNTQFGIYKYSSDDMFPVLYTTVRNNTEGRCSFVGYRITPTLTDGEISSFSITEVQTIYLPIMTDENCLGNVNIAVDHERGCLWGYGRNNNSSSSNYLKARYTRFPMPNLFDTNSQPIAEVIYNDSDIIDSFGEDYSLLNVQGGFIKNGKLVLAQGYASVNYINIRVIDLYLSKKMVSYVDLLASGFTEEPEGMFFWNGDIYTSCLNTNIWKFTF